MLHVGNSRYAATIRVIGRTWSSPSMFEYHGLNFLCISFSQLVLWEVTSWCQLFSSLSPSFNNIICLHTYLNWFGVTIMMENKACKYEQRKHRCFRKDNGTLTIPLFLKDIHWGLLQLPACSLQQTLCALAWPGSGWQRNETDVLRSHLRYIEHRYR